MTGLHEFQYSVLRYVHDVTTGEFLNVGLALFSAADRVFKVRLLPHYRRITATFPAADGEFYRQYVSRMQTDAEQIAERVARDQLSLLGEDNVTLPDLLSEVLVPDDSSMQFGPVRGGLVEDFSSMFDELYARLVEKHLSSTDRATRDDAEVWNMYRQALQEHRVVEHLRPHRVETRYDPVELSHAWKNGHWNAVEPVSFDLMHPGSIQRKAKEWLGQVKVLNTSDEWGRLFLLLGAPRQSDPAVVRAYNSAKRMLSDEEEVQVVEEHEAESFARELSSLIDSHG